MFNVFKQAHLFRTKDDDGTERYRLHLYVADGKKVTWEFKHFKVENARWDFITREHIEPLLLQGFKVEFVTKDQDDYFFIELSKHGIPEPA